MEENEMNITIEFSKKDKAKIHEYDLMNLTTKHLREIRLQLSREITRRTRSKAIGKSNLYL